MFGVLTDVYFFILQSLTVTVTETPENSSHNPTSVVIYFLEVIKKGVIILAFSGASILSFGCRAGGKGENNVSCQFKTFT